MSKFKRWLYNRFLPAWCKEDLLSCNVTLVKRLSEAEQENKRLEAYIAGMETALRRCGRITINSGVKP